MIRRSAGIVLAVLVIVAIAWRLRSPASNPISEAATPALDSARDNESSSASLAQPVVAVASDRAPIESTSDADSVADTSDDECTVFGRVTCASISNFDPTRGRVRVSPSIGRAVDVVPSANGDYEARGVTIGRCVVRHVLEGCAPFETTASITSSDRRVRVDIDVQAVRTLRVFLHDASGTLLSLDNLREESSMLNGTLQLALTRSTPMIGQEFDVATGMTIEPIPIREGEASPSLWRKLSLPLGQSVTACLLLRGVVIAAVDLGLDRDDVTLVFDSTTLAGGIEASVIDDTTGFALSDVRMTVEVIVPSLYMGARVLSDTSGRMRGDWIRAGKAHVSLRRNSYVPFERDIEIVAGQTFDLGVVRLVPGVSIAGIARMPDGSNARYRLLQCWPESTSTDRQVRLAVAQTDSDGRFQIDGLQRGVQVLGRYPDGAFTTMFFGEQARFIALNSEGGKRDGPRVFAHVDVTGGSVEGLSITIEDER